MDIHRWLCLTPWSYFQLILELFFYKQNARVPAFWKISECEEFCFDWNVRQLSGNSVVCQGIMLLLMKH